jgi:hypothetical protein
MGLADDLARALARTNGQLAEERYWQAVKREFAEAEWEWNPKEERYERSPGGWRRWVRSSYDPFAKSRMP